MLPRELLRERFDWVQGKLAERGVDAQALTRWRSLDEARRRDLVALEDLRQQRNEASKAIGELKRRGEDAGEQIAAVGDLKGSIEELEGRVTACETELGALEMTLPNLAADEVPVGEDEAANRLERTVGEPPAFDFEARPHWEIGVALGILDFESAAKVAGARFATYLGHGARLERALAAFMLERQGANGYTEVIPPYIVNRASLEGTGQLPKFEQDLFHLEGHDYFLVPTAEVPLTNLHREETLEEADLPRRYTALTPCFRSEAGSYGRDTRGLIRQHQFHKVELVQIVTPETSSRALQEMTTHAESILQELELAYRVVTLSSGDMGFQAAQTLDIEVWLPAQETYREISSCSNCRDFQARRAGIRYRPADGGKPRFAHTLNGSGLAVGRTFVALLENYQQADGSVVVPEALRPFMGGLEAITPPA